MTSLSIDIERLHYAVDNLQSTQRGIGKTYARIALMSGEIELADPGNKYLYVCENNIQRDYAINMCAQHCTHILGYKPKINWSTSKIVVGDKTFMFVSILHLLTNPTMLRGLVIAGIYFDVSPHTLDKLSTIRMIEVDQALAELNQLCTTII